jgi:hypothetical protein
MPLAPAARQRGSSIGAPSDERGQLSPYSMEEPNHGANSIKSGAGGSMSSRAASPSFSMRSRVQDIFEPAGAPLPPPAHGRGPSRTGSVDTRAESINTRSGSIDMQPPRGYDEDTISIFGPGEGEITMMFEEPSFTLDEPTVKMTLDEPMFVLEEPAAATRREDEPEIASFATHGSRIGGGGGPESVRSLDLGMGLVGANGSGNVGTGIGRSRSPSFGRSISPGGLSMGMGGASPGISRSASPSSARIPSPNGPRVPRSASPSNFGRSASPHALGRSISPNGVGRSISPSPPSAHARESGSTLGRSVSPGLGRSVSPGPDARLGRSTSPNPAQSQNGAANPSYAQGRSTGPPVTKSASQDATSKYAASPAGQRNASPASVNRVMMKSASQGATTLPPSHSGPGGARAPVAKSANGVNGSPQAVNGGHTPGANGGANGGYAQGANGSYGQTKTTPTPVRSRSAARDSLPPPAVPPKEAHHQHTLSYPVLQQNGLGSTYTFTSGSSSNATSTPTSTTTTSSNVSTVSTSSNHTSRPVAARSSSSSSSSPVVEHTATYGAMQLPPMRFSLSDTDFTDLLKGVGVDANGKIKLSDLGVPSGRGSLDQERDKKPVQESKPATVLNNSKPATEQEKSRPSVEAEKRRPSTEQRPSLEAPGTEPFPRSSSALSLEPRPSVSSESRSLAEPLFPVILEGAESATANVLDDDEEDFGRDTTMSTPIIRTTLAPASAASTPGLGGPSPYLSAARERLDSTASFAAQSDAIVRRLKEIADGAQERGSTSVKINMEFLDVITKAVVNNRDKYSDLKGRYDGMKVRFFEYMHVDFD